MAGSITVSSITLDSDNNFSIKSNTGATLFFANTTGIDVANSLPSSSITNDKIVSVANTKITGNIVSSQITSVANTQITGNLTATTATTATNLAGGSNGTIPYQSAAGTTQMLAVGTAGQVLQTNGAGAPTWATPSSGSLVLLSTVTASSSATVDIESTFNSTYDSYLIVFSNAAPSADTNNIRVLLKINGTYQTSGYNYHAARPDNTSGSYSAQGASAQSMINLMGGVVQDSRASVPGSTSDMHIRINAPASTATIKSISWNGSMAGTTNAVLFGSGQFVTSFQALTGVRFFYASGNILTGVFRLYGLANS
jgi:hypothetical protein